MAFFRSLRNKLHLGKSADDSPLVSLTRSEKDNINFRRNVTNSRSASYLSRGNENAQESISSNLHHSDSSTLEKKLKKPKMPGKFNTLSVPKKPPTLNANEGCAHNPSDHATNFHYKWKSDVPTKLAQPNAMSDLQSDPFNFLFEKLPTLKELRKKSANTEQLKSSGGTRKSMAATFFDSSTFKRTEDRMQSDSKNSDEGTLRNPQEEQKHRKQSSKTESEKYCSITINDFREIYGEKLFDLLKEAPDNPPWFEEVEQPGLEVKDVRSRHELPLESRPDFFENKNYKPLSKWILCEHQPRRPEPSKCSLVKRNEAFPIVPSTSAQTKPSPKKEPTIRIDHKNSIIPNIPGRIMPVGVAKSMPPSLGHNHNSTNHHTRRLTKLQSPLEASASSTKSSGGGSQNPS